MNLINLDFHTFMFEHTMALKSEVYIYLKVWTINYNLTDF